MNLGLKALDLDAYDYFIMSNNDLRFEIDFIKSLYCQKFPNEVFVVFPDVITDGDQHENPRFLEKISKRRRVMYWLYYKNYTLAFLIEFILLFLKLGNRHKQTSKQSKQTKIYLGVGACFILTRSYLRNYERLDDSVFLWGEEVLLLDQVRSAGGIQIYDPSLIVHHDAHSSVSSIVGRKKYELMNQSYQVYKSYF